MVTNHIVNPSVNRVTRCVFEMLERRELFSGTVFVVNTLADVVGVDGAVSLREAIEAANTNAMVGDAAAGTFGAVDVIEFDAVAIEAELGVGQSIVWTIELGGGALEVSDDLRIEGLGAGKLWIDAMGQSRVFEMVGSETTVELRGITVSGGVASGVGHGIHNAGILTLVNVTVEGNGGDGGGDDAGGWIPMGDGGGIYNAGGALTLINSTVRNNAADSGRGGGIFNAAGLTHVSHSLVEGNSANVGGGVFNEGGDLRVNHSRLLGNNASSMPFSHGGGVFNVDGTMQLEYSTVAGNHAGMLGGGIFNSDSSLEVLGSRIEGNVATFGGGIQNSVNGVLSMTDSEVVGNVAERGGGIRSGSGSELVVRHSRVSDNDAYWGGGLFNENTSVMWVIDSELMGNVAGEQGGGAYNRGELNVVNSIVSGNKSVVEGGGVYHVGGRTHVNHSTVVANRVFDESGPTGRGGGVYGAEVGLVLSNSIVVFNEAASDAQVGGVVERHANVVGVDPLFVLNPSAGGDGVWGTEDDVAGDLHLQTGSVAINVGDNDDRMADGVDLDGDGDLVEPLPLDLDGEQRTMGGTVDAGAYEYQGFWIGDFNGDGVLGIEDVDLLSAAIAGEDFDSQYDLARDGALTSLDGRVLLVDLIGTHEGDFDVDGQVDVADLSKWAVGFGSGSLYSQGDANFDGQVDVADLSLWAVNFGKVGQDFMGGVVMAPIAALTSEPEETPENNVYLLDASAAVTPAPVLEMSLESGFDQEEDRWGEIRSLMDLEVKEDKFVGGVLDVIKGVQVM